MKPRHTLYMWEVSSNRPITTNIVAKFKGSVGCNGVFYQTLQASSDSRIKKNIEIVPDDLALEQIKQIECYYYDYKNAQKRSSDKKIVGFLAQQVCMYVCMWCR